MACTQEQQRNLNHAMKMTGDEEDVTVSISYIKDDEVYSKIKPYMVLLREDIQIEKSNCRFVTGMPVVIKDTRSRERYKKFNACGFEFMRMPSSRKLDIEFFLNPKMAQHLSDYLEDTRIMIQKRLASSKAICFDWRVSTFSIDWRYSSEALKPVHRSDATRNKRSLMETKNS